MLSPRVLLISIEAKIYPFKANLKFWILDKSIFPKTRDYKCYKFFRILGNRAWAYWIFSHNIIFEEDFHNFQFPAIPIAKTFNVVYLLSLMTTITMEEKELSRERYVECDRKLILSTLLSYSVLTFVTLVQLYLVFIIAVQTLRNIDNNTSICSFTLFCSSFKKIYIRIVFTYFLSHVCYEIPSKTLSRKKNT